MDRKTFLQKIKEAGGPVAVQKAMKLRHRESVYRLHPKCPPKRAVKLAKVLGVHPADLNSDVFGELK